jgi:peptidoglycan/LPS O-acetylase OafA/YrhL
MQRQYGLDLARLSAAYLVVFGHLVFGGTFGVDDAFGVWAGPNETLPLLSKQDQSAWIIDYFALVHWRTASAIIGVALFFLISGWVVPPMRRRYTVHQFLTNRALRIFPMLICAIFLAVFTQYFVGDPSMPRWTSVFSTMLLANEFSGSPMTLGVLWTLIIEVKFYILLAILGHLSHRKIFGATAAILTISALGVILVKSGHAPTQPYVMQIVSGHAPTQPYVLQIVKSTIHDFYFVIFMFIGASLWIALESPQLGRTAVFRFLPTIFLILAFNINRYMTVTELRITPVQDFNLVTQAITFLFFGLCIFIQRCFPNGWFLQRVIGPLSNVTYSLYLIHMSIGVFLLSRLRHYVHNQYLLLLIVIAFITVTSALTYRFIEVPGNRLAKTLNRRDDSVSTLGAASVVRD